MNWKKKIFIWKFAAIAIAGAVAGPGIAMAQSEEESAGMEILTRGPVHEAFAEIVAYDPTPGIIVDAEPPNLIDEILPDQRPEGDNVVWIPGYWAWDEEPNDFLWISGIWRNLPPDREWIPGYWAPVDGRFQWTSGYWEDSETTEVTYLPEPPRSVEVGPNIPASSDDQTWIPGSWQYQQDNYAWRAGYWVDARPDWCWTPSYYRWSRRGYVYVNGYWDYPIANRGVIFAPVRFQRSYYSRPGFSYSPLAVISLSVFSNHLFLRPSYCHYYFGDYYEPRYRDHYYPSYSYHGGRRGYDPIFAYNRWENRNDRNWGRERQNYYEYRRDNISARPPRTWAALNERPLRDRQRGDYGVAARYDQVVRDGGEGRQRYQAVSTRERERFVSQKQELRTFGRERQNREMSSAPTRDARNDDRGSNRLQVGRSPVGGKNSGGGVKDVGTPPRLTDRKPSKGVASNPFPDSKKVVGTRPQVGNRSNETTKESSRNADTDGGKSTAEVTRNATRETRTQPGQRRASSPSSNNKAVASAEARDSGKSKGKADLTSKRQPASLPNGMSKATSNSRQADTKSQFTGKPYPKSETATKSQGKAAQTTKRQASPSTQGKVAPATQSHPSQSTQRNVAPVPQRKAVPTVQRSTYSKPQSKANPTVPRKTYSAPERKVAPAPQRNTYSAPQRKAAPAPQRNTYSAPQRKAAPAPQRNTYSAPQRKAAPAPQRNNYSAPQRKAAPAPTRQSAPAPQRQATPSPQRQAAPSSSRGSATKRSEQVGDDRSTRGKKN